MNTTPPETSRGHEMIFMFQLVHVTALYSNAVLVAILPHFTQVAKTLELPIPTPIVQSQVRHFFCDPRAGEIGGWVTLTNGYQFWFEKGHVNMFESPHAYFSLQDPDLISKFRGKIRMTTNEAVVYAAHKMAEITSDETIIYKNKLKITLAPKDGGVDIPHCKIQWFNVAANNRTNVVAEFEVNLDAGRIEQFAFLGKQFRRRNPEIGIKPELLSESKPQYTGGNRLTPVSASYSNAFIRATLPQITAYAEKLKLPVNLPLQPNQFRDVQIGLLGGDTVLQITLTNGYRFNYDNGYVAGFYAPDCFFTYDWEHGGSMKHEDFLGPLTTPQSELIALAREAVHRLGYSENLLHMEGKPHLLGGPDNKATNGVTRYLYGWGIKDVGTGIPQVTVSVEVDAKTKTVKSLFLSSTNLWREPPKIDVPAEMPQPAQKLSPQTRDDQIQLVEMTAAYSNAVLVAILPHFTDVAKKLELPFPTPIVQSQVRHFVCDPRANEVGGWVVLTNGYQFWFQMGHVDVFESPDCYFTLQDPALISKLYGTLRMTSKEAVELARQSLKKLGYTNEVFDAVEPDVELATPKEWADSNQGVPQYKVLWHDPDLPKGYLDRLAEVDVNADAKRVERIVLINKKFRKPNPDVGVKPKLLPKPKPEAFLIGGRRLTPVSAAYSNACMNTLMPIFTDFAAKLDLPMSLPITREQCTNVECWLDKGEPSVQIILTNGARFNFNHGYVFAFYAGDNFYWGDSWGQPVVRPEDLYWPYPVSTNEMIQLARDAFRKLGYDKKLPEIENQPSTVYAMQDSGTNHFTRYQVGWDPVDIPGVSGWKVSAEVDAKTKTIKLLYLDNTNLWREPPKIDVPPEAANPK